MSTKGRPTKHILTYEQKVWDNYNQYHPIKEATDKELADHKHKSYMGRLEKQYAKLAKLAGIEATKAHITILSKRALRNV